MANLVRYQQGIESRAIQRTHALFEHLLPLRPDFTVTLWDGSALPGAGKPRFNIVIRHAEAPRRMLRPPLALALGEAFVRGDFDIEGDLYAAFSLFSVLTSHIFTLGDMVALGKDWLALPAAQTAANPGRPPARLRGSLHTRERDRAATQYHYDVGNEFYGLWLDHNMQYSCAYFATGLEDLDTAQLQKMEHICRKLRLKPGERLLDIGCGWGGLARYAAKRYGAHVLGVTLSEQQMLYANREAARMGLNERASVKLQDYRDLAGESFDKIVSVGMFEHVGRANLPEYFGQAYRLLKPGVVLGTRLGSLKGASHACEQV